MDENFTSSGTGVCAKPKTGTCAKRGRFWAVTDAAGQLVCLAVYRKGAEEVLRRLGLAESWAVATDNIRPTDTDTTTDGRGEKRWPTRESL